MIEASPLKQNVFSVKKNPPDLSGGSGGKVKLRHVLFACMLLVMGGMPERSHAQIQSSIGREHPLWIGFSGGVTSGSAVPFNVQANRYGTVDSTSSAIGLRAGGERSFRLGSLWQASIGGEVLTRASQRSTAHLHQAYGRLSYRGLRFQAGRWEEKPTTLADTSLSMGAMLQSQNAPPMPKLRLWMPRYVTVPGMQSYLGVKASITHGWFTNKRFVEGPWLHQKSLYLRILPMRFPVQIHAGILQATTWGGTHPTAGNLPQDLEAFARVLAGRAGGTGSLETEQKGTLGNTVAGYDGAITFQTDTIRGRMARYFHHTDRPSLAFRNPWDGLWTVRLERREPGHAVDAVMWEHLNATRHNAKFTEGEVRGQDSYYNNSVYRSGWTYRGWTLGTPLLLPNRTGPGVGNNIVVAHRIGVEGHLAGLRYWSTATYSRHYGALRVCSDANCTARVNRPTERTDQYSMLLGGERSIGAFLLRAEGAADLGDLFEPRVGLRIDVIWRVTLHPSGARQRR